ncbi:chymotrypsinogen B-like isoform X2 [Choristoneura fumiferana]
MWWLFILACCVCAEKQLQRPRVYLGEEDTNSEFPYVIGIQDEYGMRICTCSLIARNWILTAGHCATFDAPTYVRYDNMTLKLNETKAFRRIIEFFQHPNFLYVDTDGTIENDIALALIQDVPKGRKFGKLSAIDYKALLGYPVRYAGYGYTGDEFSNESDQVKPLQTGDAVVIACEPEWPRFGPAICVAPKCSNHLQDTRPGDSGCPLVYRGKIVGVLIGGNSPISEFLPVSPNLGWISSIMKRYS